MTTTHTSATSAASASSADALPETTARGGALLLPTPDVIGTRAPILIPASAAALLAVASVAATLPLVRVAYASRPELLPVVTAGLWITAVLTPVVVLSKGLVLGGVAWSVLVLTGARARYRALVSAVTWGQVIFALEGAWLTLLLWFRGRGALHAPSDLILPIGLDAFVHDPASALAAAARGVTPFHLLWFVFLSVVAARVARCAWWRAGLAALTIWVLATGLGVIRAVVA